jgi:hypothetical protein
MRRGILTTLILTTLLPVVVASAFVDNTQTVKLFTTDSAPTATNQFGPQIKSVSVSDGDATLAVIFRKTSTFKALIESSPKHVRLIALGHHAAGPATVKVPLGKLAPGEYALVINPTHRPATAPTPSVETRPVLLKVTAGGAISAKIGHFRRQGKQLIAAA